MLTHQTPPFPHLFFFFYPRTLYDGYLQGTECFNDGMLGNCNRDQCELSLDVVIRGSFGDNPGTCRCNDTSVAMDCAAKGILNQNLPFSMSHCSALIDL